jgi:hypothetical protein
MSKVLFIARLDLALEQRKPDSAGKQLDSDIQALEYKSSNIAPLIVCVNRGCLLFTPGRCCNTKYKSALARMVVL